MKSRQIIKKAVELGKKYRSGELEEENEIRAYEAIQSVEAAEDKKYLLFIITKRSKNCCLKKELK